MGLSDDFEQRWSLVMPVICEWCTVNIILQGYNCKTYIT